MLKKKVFSVFLIILSLAILTSCKRGVDTNYQEINNYTNNKVLDDAQYYSLSAMSSADRTTILGQLEQYAIENNMTGITLYESGSYVQYNKRVNIPTAIDQTTGKHTYVVGYGFGILEEGSLTGNLSGVTEYANYYRTYSDSDPGTINYMNDKGSLVSTYYGYINTTLFASKLASSKTQYEWFPALASQTNKVGDVYRPIPLDASGNEQTSASANNQTWTKYRIYLNKDAKYGYGGSRADLQSYNGRTIKAEDYVTTFKTLWNQSNGLARGSVTSTTAGAIKGSAEYYNATKSGYNQTAWDNVGIKIGTKNGEEYIDFEFYNPYTPFFAMYYLTSTLYSPIPQSFIDSIGGIKNYGSFSSGNKPQDVVLSTGAYVLTGWQQNKYIIFEKNTYAKSQNGTSSITGLERYQIPGIYVDINQNIASDENASWNKYKKEEYDYATIPTALLDQEKNNSLTQITRGTSTFKLNINSTTQEEWNSLFGENGSVTQTSKSDYWNVKPLMSEDDFIKALQLSVDRVSFADTFGKTPSANFFSDAYLSDPEINQVYNDTDAHKNAMESYYGKDIYTGVTSSPLNYTKAVAKAIQLYKDVCEKLINNGTYKRGQTVDIEIWWMYESQVKKEGAILKQNWEDIFNNSGAGLKVNFINNAVTEWSDVYYKHLMVGQFDLGFGSISGSTFSPIDFMGTLRSDNNSGFTLNWSGSSNDPSKTISVNIGTKSYKFTYDALQDAANTYAIVSSTTGAESNYYGIEIISSGYINNDNTNDYEISFKMKVAMSNTTSQEVSENGAVIKNITTTADFNTLALSSLVKADGDGNLINIPYNINGIPSVDSNGYYNFTVTIKNSDAKAYTGSARLSISLTTNVTNDINIAPIPNNLYFSFIIYS